MAYFEISQRILNQEDTMEFYHNHTFFEMYFLMEGKKIYYTEKTFYNLHKGHVVISKPYDFHKFEGGPFNRILIAFDGNILSSFQADYLSNLSDKTPVLEFSLEDFNNIIPLLENLLNYYNTHVNKDFNKLSIELSHIIYLLYTQTIALSHYKNSILDNTDQKLIPNIPSVIYKLIQYIDLNYNKTINLDTFSQTHNISKPWLYKHFKESTGLTMLEYKHKRQIGHAMKLLNETSYSIHKISQLIGMPATSYFISTFIKITGTTPLKYRNIVKSRK